MMTMDKADVVKMIPEWIKELKPEDLPEVYQEMAELVGMEATIRLAQVYAGGSVYFPILERALVKKRDKVIRAEFDGANVKHLARRWGLSARHVRHIVNPPKGA